MAWPEAPVIRSGAAPSNSLTLAHLLERADLDLGKTAIVFEGRTRTYRELRIASRKVANALVGLGIEPGHAAQPVADQGQVDRLEPVPVRRLGPGPLEPIQQAEGGRAHARSPGCGDSLMGSSITAPARTESGVEPARYLPVRNPDASA